MEGCCDDEWSLEKVEDDQQQVLAKKGPQTKYHLLYETPLAEVTIVVFARELEIEELNTGPPEIPKPDLNILYHNLKLPAALQS